MRTRRFVILATISTLGFLILWLSRPRSDDLRDTSAFLDAASTHLRTSTYAWLPNGHLISFGKSEDIEINANTGAAVTLRSEYRKLDTFAVYNPTAGDYNDGLFSVWALLDLSPDGHWVIGSNGKETRGMDVWTISRIDGTSARRWKSVSGHKPAWSPDCRRVALVTGKYDSPRVEIRSMLSPDRFQTLPLPSPGMPDYLGFNAAGELMASDAGPSMGRFNSVGFRVFRTDSSAPNGRDLTLIFPQPAQIYELVFAPGGDRIIWSVGTSSVGAPGWLRPVLKAFGRHTEAGFRYEVWVSHADGKDFHRIGGVPGPGSGASPYCFKWTPDGKNFSFLIGKKLYLASAR